MHIRSFIVLAAATSSMVQASTFWKAGALQNTLARLTGVRYSENMIYSDEVEDYLQRLESEREQAPPAETQGIFGYFSNYLTRRPIQEVKENAVANKATKEKAVAAKVLKVPEFELYAKMCKDNGGTISRFGARLGKRKLTKTQKLLELQRIMAEEELAKLGVDANRLNYLVFESRGYAITTTVTEAPDEHVEQDEADLDLPDFPPIPLHQTIKTEHDEQKATSPAAEASTEKSSDDEEAEVVVEAANAEVAKVLTGIEIEAPMADASDDEDEEMADKEEHSRLISVLESKEKTTENVLETINAMKNMPKEEARMLKELAETKPIAAYKYLVRQCMNSIALRPNPPIRDRRLFHRTVTQVRVYRTKEVSQEELDKHDDLEVISKIDTKAETEKKSKRELKKKSIGTKKTKNERVRKRKRETETEKKQERETEKKEKRPSKKAKVAVADQ